MSTGFGARGRMSAEAERLVRRSGHLLYRVLCICRLRLGRRRRRATGGLGARLGNVGDRYTHVVRWFTFVLGGAVSVARAVENCERTG
jgi:hypothetical protein